MNKIVTMAVALLLVSVAAQAAPKPAAAAPSTPATNEPKGVRVKWVGSALEPDKPRPAEVAALIEWGTAAEDIDKRFPGTLGKACFLGDDGDGDCNLGLDWTTDYGEVSLYGSAPTLTMHAGQFYQYQVLFASRDLDVLKGLFGKALGRPVVSKAVPTQNAFGAKFTGHYILWKAGRVEVVLTDDGGPRGQGLLRITNTALAPPEKKEEGRAPF